jgi:Holliday junction resolvase RusA-like endonuclease
MDRRTSRYSGIRSGVYAKKRKEWHKKWPGGLKMETNKTRGGLIILPWPDKILSPNFRGHRAVKAKAVKSARKVGGLSTLAAGVKIDWEGDIHFWVTFYPPSKRRYDDDNLVAQMKAARDGIADALGVDDKQFRLHVWLSDTVVKGGRVEVKLTPGPENSACNPAEYG